MTIIHRDQLIRSFNDIKELKELHFNQSKPKIQPGLRQTGQFGDQSSGGKFAEKEAIQTPNTKHEQYAN